MILDHFSSDYHEARSKFLTEARSCGARLRSFRNPAVDYQGRALHTDVAALGPSGRGQVLLLNSATHGVEGYCGSACLIAALRDGVAKALGDRVALVLVHAINPYGFAHDRRVNEDNVDLNRNFVDHRRPPPDPEDYAFLHRALVPEDWAGPARTAADRILEAYRKEKGWPAFQRNVMAGQYSHPDGLFYGGRSATWSSIVWRRIVRDHASSAGHLGFIDFHTGLGAKGMGEVISIGRSSDELERARSWYGEVTSTTNGTSTSTEVRGDLARVFDLLSPPLQVTPVALEFGTVPLDEMLESVRADNWLHCRSSPTDPGARSIKAAIRSAFYPEEDRWKEQVTDRALNLVHSALRGLRDD